MMEQIQVNLGIAFTNLKKKNRYFEPKGKRTFWKTLKPDKIRGSFKDRT